MTTDTEIPQWNRLSPVLFMLYLAQTLKNAQDTTGFPAYIKLPYAYTEQTSVGKVIPLQWADDICCVTTHSKQTPPHKTPKTNRTQYTQAKKPTHR